MNYYAEIRTLVDTVVLQARRIGDQTALICDAQRVTYGELDQRSERVAHALAALGLPTSSCIAYLGKDSVQYFEVLFACAKTSMVFVPINWRLTAEEIQYILHDSESVVLFVESEFMGAMAGLQRELPQLRALVRVDLADYAQQLPASSAIDTAQPLLPSAHADQPIVQIYTSGTTGRPKGVVLAHRSFTAVRDALWTAGEPWFDWYDGDVNLVAVPGFHIGGLWWAIQGFNAGILNVIMRAFTPAAVVDLIGRHQVTTVGVVPAMLQMMLNEHGVTTSHFASVRKVVYGGSPISESLLRQALSVMKCDFVQVYGLTETGNTAVCLPPRAHQLGGVLLQSAGRPYPGFEAKIVSSEGLDLAAEQVGEIWLRTPAAMLEYWRRPEDTQAVLVDGWIRTGDAGYLDAAGYLFVCDRLKDMIIVAGEKIYPAEVENALSKLDMVQEAAVIGVPDARWGEAVLALVVPGKQAQPTPRALMLALRGLIADYKIPTQYQFVEAIPRNGSGKILRRTLREKYWAGQGRHIN